MTTSSVTLPRPTHRGSSAVTGLAIAVASALAFSSSGPFVKPLLDGGWSLGAVLLVRMGLAALLLSPALVRAIRRQRGFVRRHGLLIVSFGLTAVAGCQLFYFAAMQRMPVAVALLIQYIAPVLIVIAVWVRTRRSPSKAVLVGSVVAMAGLVLVVDISGARFDLLGTIFALCAAVCAAAYFVIAGRAGDDLPPLALAAGGLLTGTLLMGVLVLTGALPFAAPSITVSLAGLELPGILPLLWVGAVATTVGYALGVIAVPLIGSRLASFVGLSEVLFALGFAWLLLGETPAPIQFAGGALILVGVVLVRMDAGSPTEQKTETASIPVVPAP
ncbi:drug/metabolite transporter (DMT)-like permease [Microbacterium sp. 1154]|uniref:DMT family transporter n=1 Tax=Microbacterium sp. 1154 TaxID=2817733 RepID=UPI0028669DFA|nr:DMT family transporter [Microbacterium sp. 1154]MDR6692357.1 drug/metabolite transporter (DMT)-like permease [Microbacterium sp. 1154]